MIGGGGEKKTLRMVAKYADACNLFATPDVGRKLDVLKEHCEREGRNYDDILQDGLLPVRHESAGAAKMISDLQAPLGPRIPGRDRRRSGRLRR